MQNTQIFLVDDSDGDRDYARKALERAGHKVVIEATCVKDVQAIIASGQLAQLGVNVAVVDGCMGTTTRSPWDGMVASRAINNSGLQIKVIAHTSFPKSMTPYGDGYANKGLGAKGLVDAVAAL